MFVWFSSHAQLAMVALLWFIGAGVNFCFVIHHARLWKMGVLPEHLRLKNGKLIIRGVVFLFCLTCGLLYFGASMYWIDGSAQLSGYLRVLVPVAVVLYCVDAIIDWLPKNLADQIHKFSDSINSVVKGS